MQLSPEEQRVVDAIADRRDAIVALTSELVAFDTVTHTAGAAPRQERALQEHLAALLRGHGAEVELTEPDASSLRPHPMVPDDLEFDGRPQLVARFRGSGGGSTLLLNGHVDVVDVEPRADWTQPDPFIAVVRDGLLYGRGSCDMKGGVAGMVLAACTLAELGVPLAGDLVVNTVTEEESTGAGGLFAARTLRADAAIVPEPSGLVVWVACRGSLLPRITVRGRAGHAGIHQLPHELGGAVNAIEKMAIVLEAVRRLREHWVESDDSWVKRYTTQYRIEYRSDYVAREHELCDLHLRLHAELPRYHADTESVGSPSDLVSPSDQRAGPT